MKYRWSEKNYDDIVGMCVALTNWHMDHLPLRATDGDWFKRYMNQFNIIVTGKKPKRDEQQSMYRSRCNNRVRVGCRALTVH